MEIKKGDWFKCISTKGLTDGFYTKDQYYKSDRDGFITDNHGDIYHKWDNLKSFEGDLIFQKLYTLQDLKDGKCAIYDERMNRLADVNKILKTVMMHEWDHDYEHPFMFIDNLGRLNTSDLPRIPSQSVEDFLPQIEMHTKDDFSKIIVANINPNNPIEPPHYGGADNPFEAIKIIQHYNLSFELGNVVKYILRHDKKGSSLDDLNKAKRYLEFEISKYN